VAMIVPPEPTAHASLELGAAMPKSAAPVPADWVVQVAVTLGCSRSVVFTIAPRSPTAHTTVFAGDATARKAVVLKVSGAPGTCEVQVAPPSFVRSTVPPTPTARASKVDTADTARSWLDVPEVCGVQTAPP